jgi:tetratricopeptide (TPR) repeat protein
LIGAGIGMGTKVLVREPDLERRTATLVAFSGWVTVLAVAAVHQFNMPHAFAFWLFFGLLSSMVARESLTWNGGTGARGTMIAGSAAFAVLSVAAICVAWLSGQRLAADMAYSRAVSAYGQGKPVDTSIERLETASALNRWNDVYPRNLSQAYLIKLKQLTDNSTSANGVPSAEDQKKIGEAMQEMFRAAQRAVDLNPSNVDNFSNLAILAEAVASFTPGSDERAIAAFQSALEREPANALFQNELGKIYVMRADAFGTRVSDPDPNAQRVAKAAQQEEWQKAETALAKAIELKPDLAAAHYNLGILYERQGRVKQAVLKLEQVLTANDRDVGIAFQLGILYYRDGQKDKAIRMFEQILQLDPGYLNARWFLAAMYEEKGMFNEAIAQLMLVDEALPQNSQVQQAIGRLKAQRDAGKKPAAKPLPEPIKQDVSGPGSLNPIKP